MARPGLLQHRKFKRFARMVGDTARALGSLELIWASCYEHGDDYLGDTEDVEAAACWGNEPGQLVTALLRAGGDGNHGFIENIPERPGHYRVHDLYDHAPEYVQKRMVREAARAAKGKTIADLRREAGKRGRAAQLAPTDQANGGQTADICQEVSDNHLPNVGQPSANGVTLEPAPVPIEQLPPTPFGVGAPKAGVGGVPRKPKRRTRAEVLLPFPPAVRAWVNRVAGSWPTEDTRDGRAVRMDPEVLAENVQAILADQPGLTLDLLEEAARNYLASAPQRWKAPQFFFGPGKAPEGPPWRPWTRALLPDETHFPVSA